MIIWTSQNNLTEGLPGNWLTGNDDQVPSGMPAFLKALQDMGIGRLPGLLVTLTTHTTTDLSAEQLLTMTASLYGLDFEETPNLVVPGAVGTAGSASVVFLGEGAADVFADLADGVLSES